MTTPQQESHTITLQIGETAEPLRIALPPGDIPAEGILPALRIMTNAVIDHAIAATRARGRPISCKPGCAACCRHLVLVSDIEARVLADLVANMPEPRQSAVKARFAAAQQRMAEAGLAAPVGNQAGMPVDHLYKLAYHYFRQRIDCPFLEDEQCSIYADRPLACRKLAVTSPAEFCVDPGDDRVTNLRVAPVGAAVLLVTSEEDPPQPAGVLLPYLLDWAAANATPGVRRGADVWMQRFVERLANA
ncbi:MAG TPA: YkgJ family cysteine cluster protein [Vineibacter sp.]|nr:YkgJ family cysteine cluster protein [Vineibacter sp.]